MKTKLDEKKSGTGECQHVLEGKCARCKYPMTFNIKSCITEEEVTPTTFSFIS